MGIGIKKIMLGSLLASSTAMAIESQGRLVTDGLEAYYDFQEVSSGLILDKSGSASPLNLVIDSATPPANGPLSNGLNIRTATAVRSQTAATRLINQCNTNNEYTFEVWFRNMSPNSQLLRRPNPLRILTLSRKDGTTHRSDVRLGQDYDAGSLLSFSSSNLAYETNKDANPILSDENSQTAAQKFIISRNRAGFYKVYLTGLSGKLTKVFEGREQVADPNSTNVPLNWNTANHLSLAGEPFFRQTASKIENNEETNPDWAWWSGTLYRVAVYCRSFSEIEVLGEGAGGMKKEVVVVDPNRQITTARVKAQQMLQRLTSTKTPIDHPLLDQMEPLVAAGKHKEAAQLAVGHDDFLNLTIRDFAARMSTRETSVDVTLNDFIATVIGVARDDMSAQLLLNGDFTYRGNPSLASVPSDEIPHFLKSNAHYESLEKSKFNLAKVLVRVDGQKLLNGASNTVVRNPDPAGVITSRAFMEAHATAGTNRRLVEFTFKQFLCIPINQWADLSASDAYIGRDVDRAPGNEHDKFRSTCRSCHTVMDSFRGAFAKVDFEDGYLKHGDILGGLGVMSEDPNNRGISLKMARNATQFPEGYETKTTEWINNADRGINKEYFGWPAPASGESKNRGFGIRSFASLVSQSPAFPRCMAMRAFRSVCKRDMTDAEKMSIAVQLGEGFKASGYKLKDLFSSVAVLPECSGQ